jgi:hypothetical protein
MNPDLPEPPDLPDLPILDELEQLLLNTCLGPPEADASAFPDSDPN